MCRITHGFWLLVAIALGGGVFGGPGASTAAAQQTVVEICGATTDPAEVAAVRALGTWMRTATVVLSSCDAPSSDRYRAILTVGGSTLDIRLVSPGGESYSRTLPWSGATSSRLADLQMAGRLSELSVLVEALLADHRAGLPERFDEQPTPEPSPTVAPSEPAPVPPPPPPRRHAAPRPPRPTPSPAPAPPPPPPQQEKPKPASAPKAAPPLPQREPWASVGIFGGGRWDTPTLIAPAVTIDGAVGPIFANVTHAFAARWDLGGRPIDSSLWSIGLGVRVDLWRAGPWSLDGSLGAVTDVVTHRRADLGGVASHTGWQLGGGLGGRLAYTVSNGLFVALRGVIGVTPTAREVEILNGPARRVGVVWAEFGLGLGFALQ